MFNNISRIIPHRKPMIMIDCYSKIDDKRAFAEKTFSPGDYGCHKRIVLNSILIECVAQTVAAHFGYNAMVEKKEEPIVGMLVAVDSFEFYNSIPEQSRIRINILKTDQFGGFHMYKGEIKIQDKLMAKGKIKVFNSNEE